MIGLFILILSWISANTPLEYTLGFTGGYDSNVMRFSSAEFSDAAIEPGLMGGANTCLLYTSDAADE